MYCRKALHNLTQMVNELSYQVNSPNKGLRKVAGVKVLLRKDTLKKLERRLENAVRMLILAQQSYLIVLTQVQPDIIVQKFAALAVQGSQSEFRRAIDLDAELEEQAKPSTVKAQRNITNETTHLSSRRRWRKSTKPGIFGRFLVESSASSLRLLFQAPIWPSQRSWELHGLKALGSWLLALGSGIYALIRSYLIIARLCPWQ
ncbi:hypothetical protein F4818DRAFT_184618 [Hypoxylon cercidicola]|nr:hypothetical protein F4818DRAFT_184618 [Hypoxylon cercidicola]